MSNAVRSVGKQKVADANRCRAERNALQTALEQAVRWHTEPGRISRQEAVLLQGFVMMVKRNEKELLFPGETPADRREAEARASYVELESKPVSPFGEPHTREELRTLHISFLSIVMNGTEKEKAQVKNVGRLFATINALERKLSEIRVLAERER